MLHYPFKKYIPSLIYLNFWFPVLSKAKTNENESTGTLLPNPALFQSPPNTLARGRQYYDELKTKVKYSDCWAESLKILNQGCSKMCDDEQRRIAYQFTFCHMKASGRTLPPDCPLNEPIKTCTEKLPDLTFNVFTEFFTHVHDICFHLQQSFWQEQTENTVQKLASSSLHLTRQLEESENLALKTLEYQKSVNTFTEKLVENEKIQKSAFEDLREWIKSDVVTGLTSDIMSIHTSIHEHSKLAGTVLYYSVIVILTFVITGASVATLQARTPMLVILGICCFIEQYHSFWLEEKLTKIGVDVYIARKVVLLCNFMVLLYESIRYRDMNDVNNEILKKMFLKIESLNNEVTVLKKKVVENVGDVDYTVGNRRLEIENGGDNDIFEDDNLEDGIHSDDIYSDCSEITSESEVSANELQTVMNYGSMVFDPRYEYYRRIAEL